MSRWQDLLARSSIAADPGLNLEVSLSSPDERACLRVRDGSLALVGTDRKPDLSVRFHDFTLSEVLLGRVPTIDVFRDAEIGVLDKRRSALPAAESPIALRGSFERIPGASLSIATGVTSTIFGDVGVHERWQDGALVSHELVPLSRLERSEADVRMWCSLRQLAAIRRREVTFLDALGDGVGLLGNWPELMCFAELLQHPCYADAWASQTDVEAQIAWGSVFCSEAYGEAVRDTRSEPEQAVGV